MTGKHKKTQEQIIHELRTRVKLEEHNPENVSCFHTNFSYKYKFMLVFKRFIALIFQALMKTTMMFGISTSLSK